MPENNSVDHDDQRKSITGTLNSRNSSRSSEQSFGTVSEYQANKQVSPDPLQTPVRSLETIVESDAPEQPLAKPQKVLRFDLGNDEKDIGSLAENHQSAVSEGSASTRESAIPTQLARALYDYTQSPDDPDELSFKKDDVLVVLHTRGKWYEAETSTGRIGIVPSNYVHLMGKS